MNDVTTLEAPRDLTPALSELHRRIDGAVTIPQDASWDADRAAWALAVDQRPALVVRAAPRKGVVLTVRFAVAHRLARRAQNWAARRRSATSATPCCCAPT